MGGWLVVLKNFGLVIKETTALPRKKHKKQCNTNGPYCSTPGNTDCLLTTWATTLQYLRILVGRIGCQSHSGDEVL